MLSTLLLASTVLQSPIKATADEMNWMSGYWKSNVDGGVYEESWFSAAGGLIMGIGRFSKDNKLGNVEYDTIEQSSTGELSLWALLGRNSREKRKRTEYKLVSKESNRFIFENKANDFPQRIIYAKVDATHRFCRIEGVDGGKSVSADFDFTLVKD